MGYISQAQSYLITNVTINTPQELPAKTADWFNLVPPIMITAKGAVQNGQLNGAVIESRMLVTIKRNGSKVCGTYTANNAPTAGFNAPIKNWNSAAVLNMLGQECTLQPGDYELCVQYFGYGAQITPLSYELCKPFTVKGATPNPTGGGATNDKFTPPTNLAPNDGKQLTTKEASVPLTFRWTPCLPKPQGAVIYKLKVWQLMQGQNGTQAMKVNTPVIDKDVKEQTQFVKPNLLGDIEMLPDGKNKAANLIWNVQAIDQRGTVLGSSVPTVFGVSANSSTCVNEYQVNVDSIKCQDNNQFKVCATFKVLKSGYGISSSSYTAYPTKIQDLQFFDQSNSPISSVYTINVNKNEGQFYSICKTFTVPTGTTVVKARFTSQVQTTNPAFDACNLTSRGDTTLPSCRCELCDQISINLGQESSQFTKWTAPGGPIEIKGNDNSLYLTQPLVVGPSSIKVLQVKTEVVDFYWYVEGDCKRCNNNTYNWGNIISGNTNSTGFNTNGTSGTDDVGIALPNSHEIDFLSTTTTGSTFNGNIRLRFSLPPQTELMCCKDCFRFCIRYTIVFMENGVCKTCTKVKCCEVKRQHRKILNPILMGEQTSECGDVTNIYDQGSDIKLNATKQN